MTEESWALAQTQVQTYVSFTSFMTAVVVFFVGLLLASFNNYDISIKVPIAFLIISIFGFLFSTLVYTGAAEEVSHRRELPFRRSLFLGDVLSEYLGVYLLIISIPFVIGSVTHDPFLRSVTIVAALAGLSIYQFSHVSIMERHFKSSYKGLSFFVLLLSLALYMSQLYKFYFAPLALVYLLFSLIITYAAIKNKKALV